jgi:hypothetical protein
MMSMLCNCCVRELLILARTWFAFNLPSKTGCDTGAGHRERASRASPATCRGTRAGERRRSRAGKRRGGRERRREGEGKTHLRGSKFRRSRLQTLGHHGEREVEEGGGGCCAGNPNERGREGGAHGEVGRGARGARAGSGRTGLGWAGLGWAGPLHGSKPMTHTTLKGNQSPTEIRNRTRRTRDIRQRNALRHDATPTTLMFWFIHDTHTCHYTGLKLGRKSETGREKRVTPEFGERKEEKILPPNSGRYKPIPLKRISPSRFKVG